ncbi:DNA translocase FtsK [Lactobacillus kefiranofaciens subsp. kefirgranum]|uniref:FtsK/SpoIIIE family DNA translocase n=1 Tax=Lactobacillus kefiranofaciens TaxID=267818 RepID=UPI0006EF2AA2|nr:DNA translocase FtsK [Lactobacillus kefiranofaciens]KRL24783.1 FtsK SpoIIIE family DNA translocase [Lactobacillus kefiranofaciens subsp. kefirgranum DSM 10550 = JCM 8572]MDF4142409.1 DNA translocase FtsK [Lactobacillus kefiranofaciens]URW70516.1 DNA translocase FtsK [Lactobacillus kefiranofaciens subsp. kefirgranum]URW72459.1 DNA translocase FtsK [Lactobacillus kefiranofaciens subsp. kefirgranum]
MPVKKKKRKTKRKYHKKKVNKEQNLNWSVFGLVLLLIAVLALVRFGILGKQIANLIRLFFGDSYLFTAGLFGLFGLVNTIYNQPIHLTIKRTIGLCLAFLGVLLIQSSLYFEHELVNSGFLNSFWHAISAEFGRAGVTEDVGGGLIGSLGYQIFYPLLGQLGVRIFAILLIPIGILMFFDVKFRTIMGKFQSVSQLFIQRNKEAGVKLKNKYSDVLEKKKQKTLATEKQQQDDKTIFPDVADFDPDDSTPGEITPSSEDVEVEKTDPEPEPQIQIAPQSNETSSEKDLPKSHSFAEEDRKLKQDLANVDHGELKTDAAVNKAYKMPPISLLDPIKATDQSADRNLIKKNTQVLQSTFKSFGVKVIIKKAILGPTIIRYEVQPAVGVKVSRIVNLADDLALALAAKDIRIEAPIPGKPFIGIEVPNRATSVVSFKDVMEHQDAKAKNNPMDVPLGKDVTGMTISANLAKMPHLLIAGSTGSGKSVAINTILASILMKARPEEVKLVLIDPKMVELSVYNGVPHLLIPVVTDAKLAANALRKVVKEMERRYKLFAAGGVRNMKEYNQKAAENNQDKSRPAMPLLPYILVVVDELSDLMMVGGHDVEGAIVRLGQMARAAGIHMILATQRPSVDVITGLIKANVPSRISFAVSSGVDSRTILDQTGAEKLLGRGDMLYMPIGASKPERIQGAYIASDEVERVIDWVKKQQKADYDASMIPKKGEAASSDNQEDDEPEDELYTQAVELVRHQQTASVSMLQRRFRIGYNRAARMVDEMEAKGIVGPSEGSKPRQVLVPAKNEGNTAHANN